MSEAAASGGVSVSVVVSGDSRDLTDHVGRDRMSVKSGAASAALLELRVDMTSADKGAAAAVARLEKGAPRRTGRDRRPMAQSLGLEMLNDAIIQDHSRRDQRARRLKG